MNCVVSYYFTSKPDPQGRPPIKANDPNYIYDWYRSLIRHGVTGILFHDGWVNDEFRQAFPDLIFEYVRPDNYQLADLHWIAAHDYLAHNGHIKNIFFTDCPDVEVLINPFVSREYSRDVLYCGDETGVLAGHPWFAMGLSNFKHLDGLQEIFTTKETIYNAGLLGGSRNMVLKFTEKMTEVIEQVRHRPIDCTGDMILFNYVMHRGFNPVHGVPVNTEFKKYEYRDDVWFRHK